VLRSLEKIHNCKILQNCTENNPKICLSKQ
jgi:hypothetical protein